MKWISQLKEKRPFTYKCLKISVTVAYKYVLRILTNGISSIVFISISLFKNIKKLNNNMKGTESKKLESSFLAVCVAGSIGALAYLVFGQICNYLELLNKKQFALFDNKIYKSVDIKELNKRIELQNIEFEKLNKQIELRNIMFRKLLKSEEIYLSRIDEIFNIPPINEKIDISTTNEQIEKPFVNEHIEKPFVNEHIEKPFVNEHIEKPLVNEHIEKPLVNEHIETIEQIEKIEKPLVNEKKETIEKIEKIEKPLVNKPLKKFFYFFNLEKVVKVEKIEKIEKIETIEKPLVNEKIETIEKPLVNEKIETIEQIDISYINDNLCIDENIEIHSLKNRIYANENALNELIQIVKKKPINVKQHNLTKLYDLVKSENFTLTQLNKFLQSEKFPLIEKQKILKDYTLTELPGIIESKELKLFNTRWKLSNLNKGILNFKKEILDLSDNFILMHKSNEAMLDNYLNRHDSYIKSLDILIDQQNEINKHFDNIISIQKGRLKKLNIHSQAYLQLNKELISNQQEFLLKKDVLLEYETNKKDSLAEITAFIKNNTIELKALLMKEQDKIQNLEKLIGLGEGIKINLQDEIANKTQKLRNLKLIKKILAERVTNLEIKNEFKHNDLIFIKNKIEIREDFIKKNLIKSSKSSSSSSDDDQ